MPFFAPRRPHPDFPLFGGKRVKPSPEGLRTLLRYYGVELQNDTLEKLWAYHRLIKDNNGDQDLTRLNAFETMAARHSADCILIHAYVEEWPSRMIDAYVADDALLCVAKGAGIALDNLDSYKRSILATK